MALVSSRGEKINLEYSKIVDVTENQNGRYITSKIPFNTENVIFIFKAIGAWSNHVYQSVIFNGSTNISIFGNWENNESAYSYNTIFEVVNNNQIRVKKYAQNENMMTNNFTIASDDDFGAIKPNKIYAIYLK